MNKIWVFVEGDSEEEFIRNLLIRNYSDIIIITEDIYDFIKSKLQGDDFFACYIINCHSVDKIPFSINENCHFINSSGSGKILIICDLEELGCNSLRREAILSKLDCDIDFDDIEYVFSNPMIESEYWKCPDLIKRLVQLEYKEKYRTQKSPTINIPADIHRNQGGLKRLFKDYNTKYRESKFAKKFFPRVDFECENENLNRTKRIISNFI